MRKLIALSLCLFLGGAACLIIVGRLGPSLWWVYRDMLLLLGGLLGGATVAPVWAIIYEREMAQGDDAKPHHD